MAGFQRVLVVDCQRDLAEAYRLVQGVAYPRGLVADCLQGLGEAYQQVQAEAYPPVPVGACPLVGLLITCPISRRGRDS